MRSRHTLFFTAVALLAMLSIYAIRVYHSRKGSWRPTLQSTQGSAKVQILAKPLAPTGEPQRPESTEADPIGAAARLDSTKVLKKPSSVALRLHTFDPSGNDLAAVAITTVRASREVIASGITDSMGVLTIHLPRGLELLRLIATREGFATRRMQLPRVLDGAEELPLVMRQAAFISGRVVLGDGTPAGAGISVLAVPWRRGGDIPHRVLLAMQGVPVTAHAVTDAAGEFEITGLEPDAPYEVRAGGRGLVQTDCRQDARGSDCSRVVATTTGLTIRVGNLFGALIKVWAPGRSPLMTSELLYSAKGSVFQSHRSARELNPNSSPVLLAGIDPFTLLNRPEGEGQIPSWRSTASDGAAMIAKFYVTLHANDRIGPFRTTLSIPGYREERLEFWAAPVSGGLVPQEVELVPDGKGGFGSISLRFDGWTVAEGAYAFQSWPMGMLAFSDSTGAPRFSLPVPNLNPEPRIIDGVPAGIYEVRYEGFGGIYRYPPEGSPPLEVDVGEKVSRISIPADGLGALQIELRGAAGRPIDDGSAVAEIVPTGAPFEGHLGNTFLFAARPYRIEGLPEGVYSVKLVAFGKAVPPITGKDVQIFAGRVSMLEFEIE